MAASQTDLSASVPTAKTELQSEDVDESKEGQKKQAESVETKEHGSESTCQESKTATMSEKKETDPGKKLTSTDNEETPMQIDDAKSKSLSEVRETKASIDHGSEDVKTVGDNDKAKSDVAGVTIKQAETPGTKLGLSLETKVDDDDEKSSLSVRNTESETTKEAEDDTNKNPDDNCSEKEVGEDPKEVDSDGETQKEKKGSETGGDKQEEETAPDKDDGEASDTKNVKADGNTVSKASKETGDISKDAGETEGEAMEIAENKGADNVVDVTDDKDVKEDKAAADNKEGTEQEEDKNEDGKEPDADPEETPVPKMPNGVASKGKGRRKGNPKRALPDDTPEPSTSTAETKDTRAQTAKKESAEAPSKKRKASEQPRSQPTRRSKRRKFHGWGAKRKTKTRQDQ